MRINVHVKLTFHLEFLKPKMRNIHCEERRAEIGMSSIANGTMRVLNECVQNWHMLN